MIVVTVLNKKNKVKRVFLKRKQIFMYFFRVIQSNSFSFCIHQKLLVGLKFFLWLNKRRTEVERATAVADVVRVVAVLWITQLQLLIDAELNLPQILPSRVCSLQNGSITFSISAIIINLANQLHRVAGGKAGEKVLPAVGSTV